MKKLTEAIKRNRIVPKSLSVLMSLCILCGGVGMASYSAGAESTAPKAAASDKADAAEKNLKTETVYVIAKADGTPDKVIVSNWIKNAEGLDVISDQSNLSDVEVVKGDYTYTLGEDNAYEWQANGDDIYYKGNGTAALPVGVKVTYYLDGKQTSPEQLLGASGRVKIRFDYENREYETVKINGKNEKIYVPFVMLTGTLLDNDKFTNVEVSNGKVVNDGSRTYVAGFAMPGMQENLGIDKEQLDIPDYVEITADAKDFELSTTLTVATSHLFNDLDTDKLSDQVDELEDSLNTMDDAMTQLCDGSSALYEGIGTLLSKSGELIDGVKALNDGAQQLKTGAAQLDDGAATLAAGAKDLDNGMGSLNSGVGKLDSGAGTLDDGVATLQGYIASLSGGLNQISANSASLNGGAKQVFDVLLDTANKQIAAAGLSAEPLTIGNYKAVLNKLIASLGEDNVRAAAQAKARETVTAAVNGQRDMVRGAVESEVRKQVTEGVLSAAGLGMSMEAYEHAVAAGQIPEETAAQISAGVAAQMTAMSGTIDATTEAQIAALIEQNLASDEVQAQINDAVAQAAAGKASLEALLQQLDSYNAFYQGVLGYTAGVDQANAGAQQILGGTVSLKEGSGSLKSGTGELKSGAKQLKSGTGALKDGASQLSTGAKALSAGASQLADGTAQLSTAAPALIDGIGQLYDGASQLSDGMKQFKEEGVDKILQAYNDDLKPLSERLKAIAKVGKGYKTYSGVGADTDSEVSFIFKTEGITEE